MLRWHRDPSPTLLLLFVIVLHPAFERGGDKLFFNNISLPPFFVHSILADITFRQSALVLFDEEFMGVDPKLKSVILGRSFFNSFNFFSSLLGLLSVLLV